MFDHQPWTVLLIGGNSAAGKSTVARELSLRLGVPWYMADDFRLTLARLCGADQQPILRAFDNLESVTERSVEQLVRQRIEIGRITSSALEVVIDSHASLSMPLILEGDDITPQLAARTAFAGGPPRPAGTVRSVFLIEDDRAAIASAMSSRGRGFGSISKEAQERFVAISHGYGRWLAKEAARYDLAVIPARPWATLAERVLHSLGA